MIKLCHSTNLSTYDTIPLTIRPFNKYFRNFDDWFSKFVARTPCGSQYVN